MSSPTYYAHGGRVYRRSWGLRCVWQDGSDERIKRGWYPCEIPFLEGAAEITPEYASKMGADTSASADWPRPWPMLPPVRFKREVGEDGSMSICFVEDEDERA